MSRAVRIHIDPAKIASSDFDKLLMSKYDIFYRRIVEYVLSDLETGKTDKIMATLIDGNNLEYEMHLPKSGYSKSLHKALEYFTLIEEYETCSLIKHMIKQVEK